MAKELTKRNDDHTAEYRKRVCITPIDSSRVTDATFCLLFVYSLIQSFPYPKNIYI